MHDPDATIDPEFAEKFVFSGGNYQGVAKRGGF